MPRFDSGAGANIKTVIMVLRFQLFIDVLHAILKCLFRFLLLILLLQVVIIMVLVLPRDIIGECKDILIVHEIL